MGAGKSKRQTSQCSRTLTHKPKRRKNKRRAVHKLKIKAGANQPNMPLYALRLLLSQVRFAAEYPEFNGASRAVQRKSALLQSTESAVRRRWCAFGAFGALEGHVSGGPGGQCSDWRLGTAQPVMGETVKSSTLHHSAAFVMSKVNFPRNNPGIIPFFFGG
mgnify:CR=1 FL=1